jgi:hypothetical protein
MVVLGEGFDGFDVHPGFQQVQLDVTDLFLLSHDSLAFQKSVIKF